MLCGLLFEAWLKSVGECKSLRRSDPCPPFERREYPFAVAEAFGSGVPVPCASSPILAVADSDRHEHITTAFDASAAHLLHPSQRKTIVTNSGPLKSYRLPVRTRGVDRVVWFVLGDRSAIERLLAGVPALAKGAAGYGRVSRWLVEDAAEDWSVTAGAGAGTVLMRPVPATADALDLRGARRSFGSCQPPYWHPSKQRDVVVPC